MSLIDKKSHCSKILGYDVFFPEGKSPFPPQLAVMSKALSAMKKETSALLESPTGTGKTLSLLCSTLAWQRTYRALAFEQEKFQEEYSISRLKLEYESSDASGVTSNKEPKMNLNKEVDSNKTSSAKKISVPQIYFASRTHTQLNQAVAELKKCPGEYINDFGGIRMTLLGSRKFSCTNTKVIKTKNIDEECKKLHAEQPTGGCACESRHYITKNALPPVWDMEDLVTISKKTRGCGYYASRQQQEKAHIIFCPYNYIIDPMIRKSMDIILDQSVIIFDEAHGIEDASREASSLDIKLSLLDKTIEELRLIQPHLKQSSFTSCQKGGWSDDELDEDVQMGKLDTDDLVGNTNNYNTSKKSRTGDKENVEPSKHTMENDLSRKKKMEIEKEDDTFIDAYSCCLILRNIVKVVADWTRETGKCPPPSSHSPAAVFSGDKALNIINDMLLGSNSNASFHQTQNISESNVQNDNFFASFSLSLNQSDEICEKLQKMVSVLLTSIEDIIAENMNSFDSSTAERVDILISTDCKRMLQQLVTVLCFLCEADGINQSSYQVIIRKEDTSTMKQTTSNTFGKGKGNTRYKNNTNRYRGGRGSGGGDDTLNTLSQAVGTGSDYEICFWCLTGKVAFRALQAGCRSILLTSGTLSPLNSFTSELGLDPAPVCLEAGHVVNLSNQVFSRSLNSSRGIPLLCNYRSQTSTTYQDALGNMLLELCEVSPGGMLVFFPSYGLMSKMMERWNTTGLTSQLCKFKRLFEEPRGSEGAEALETTLAGYICAIKAYDPWKVSSPVSSPSSSLPAAPPSFNTFSNQISESGDDSHTHIDAMSQNKMNGAVLMAVCRGKVSEGIDFSDDAARVVVLVGLPFPAYKDLKVTLKRNYQSNLIRERKQQQHEQRIHLSLLAEEEKQGGFIVDEVPSSASASQVKSSNSDILDGDTWYKQQAYRALNQAVGRCIRHKNDFGAIILADPRYGQKESINNLSRWLRPSVSSCEDLSYCINDLKQFFLNNEHKRIKLVKTEADIEAIQEMKMDDDGGKVKTQLSEIVSSVQKKDTKSGKMNEDYKAGKSKSFSTKKTNQKTIEVKNEANSHGGSSLITSFFQSSKPSIEGINPASTSISKSSVKKKKIIQQKQTPTPPLSSVTLTPTISVKLAAVPPAPVTVVDAITAKTSKPASTKPCQQSSIESNEFQPRSDFKKMEICQVQVQPPFQTSYQVSEYDNMLLDLIVASSQPSSNPPENSHLVCYEECFCSNRPVSTEKGDNTHKHDGITDISPLSSIHFKKSKGRKENGLVAFKKRRTKPPPINPFSCSESSSSESEHENNIDSNDDNDKVDINKVAENEEEIRSGNNSYEVERGKDNEYSNDSDSDFEEPFRKKRTCRSSK